MAENAVNTGVSRQGASPPEPPSSRRRQKINGAGRSRTLPRLFGGIQMEQNEIRKEDYEKGGEVRSAPMKNEYRVGIAPIQKTGGVYLCFLSVIGIMTVAL